MKAFIMIALVALSQCHIHEPFITKEHVADIKETASYETYSFEEHPFRNWSESDIRGLLGTVVPSSGPTAVDLGEGCDVPESFDSRVQWPKYIHPIRDQQSCGSCWAFAASEVLSDRFAIATEGNVDVILSPQDLVSCDKGDMGCNGGYLDRSWEYIVNTGIVTDECFGYTSGGGSSGTCKIKNGQCVDKSVPYKKYHAASYTHYSNNCAIKKAIMAEGPVETGFTVYSDFMSYSRGVYTSNCRGMMGGHAVKIVGWGVENGKEYWIIANSWNTVWGEQGFVRVETGQSCLNLDTQVYAGKPDVDRLLRETFQ